MNLPVVPVHQFRTVFFWPLVLSAKPGGRNGREELSEEDFFKDQQAKLEAPGQPWRKIEDNLLHIAPPLRDESDDPAEATGFNTFAADAYGEYVYFHDFVQRALFGGTADGKRNHRLTLFQRTDIEWLELVGEDCSLSVKVERVNLYLVRPGAAILALQCASSEQEALKNVMAFNDGMRRTHVPHFETTYDGGPQKLKPGGKLFSKVTWIQHTEIGPKPIPFGFEGALDPEGKPVNPQDPAYLALLAQKPEERRVLPLPHWQWLLGTDAKGQALMPLAPPSKGGFYWRHFSDDRTQTLSTITLASRDDYYAISEGNWMRLAFVDPMGSDPHPFHASFLRETFAEHCYDRYHHPEDATADPPSRYLMCDYAMTMVNYAAGNNYAKVQATHMQRHYFQMFLLLVIDRAVMLQISSRISTAIDLYDAEWTGRGTRDRAEPKLTETLQELERDFLHYVHRFRFTGVSGQLQAGELYARMRRVMKLDAMFEDIKNELETAVSFLSSRAAQHATEAAERLNVIASLGVVAGLAIAFMALEGLIFPFKATAEPAYWQRGMLFGLVLAGFAGLALVVKGAADASMNQSGRAARPSERLVLHGLMAMAGCGVLIAMGAWAAGFLL